MAIPLRKATAIFSTRGVGHRVSEPAWFHRRRASYSSSLGLRLSLISRQFSECTFDPDGPRASSANVEDDTSLDYMEFKKWPKGGGFFHKSACIDSTTIIEIGAVVHPKTILGAGVHISSGAIIGPAVTIGQLTRIGYNAVLGNCSIGESCIIHSGVCVGQDGKKKRAYPVHEAPACARSGGWARTTQPCTVNVERLFQPLDHQVTTFVLGFGFFIDEQGNMSKKPQMLHARIGNHVEIGSNTCIDRGSWRETVIGDHSKIDNLVQIGHNVVIGERCMLCGQVGLAGSVTLGDYVTLGGRVAVRDHVNIASKVRLAANSFVTKDISVPGDYGGFPAVPIHEWRRQVATHRRIVKKGIS